MLTGKRKRYPERRPRVQRQCQIQTCGALFMALEKDVARGGGKYCSKTCTGRAAASARTYVRGVIPLNSNDPSHKKAARIVLNHAVRGGWLTRGECADIGEHRGKIEGHHPDYSKPLEVVWLCVRHHRSRHALERAQKARNTGPALQPNL